MSKNPLNELRPEVFEVVAKVRLFADDHEPDGYPAIKMKDATLLANELVRMTENFIEAVNKLTDFMGRAAEAESDADELAGCIKFIRGDVHSPGKEEAVEACLSRHASAQQWRNGEALNAYKTALRDIRRAAVALKRDTDPHAFSPDTVECSKSALSALFSTIDQHTFPNDHD